MAVYPGAAAADSDLHVAVNNLSTLLNGALTSSGDNTSGSGIAVASTTGFPTEGYITIDAEAIHYTGISGNNFTGITRGADGTPAGSHSNNANVYHNVIAAHHNANKEEIKSVEADLVNCFAALTQTQSPASTAATIFQRLSQVVTQIKTLLGTTNWYDAVAVSLVNKLSLTGGTMSGAIAMGTNKITGLGNGTAAQDAAAFGQIPVFTNWASYTPAIGGCGTVTNVNFQWKQMGDHIFVKGTWKCGTVTGSPATIQLPNGTVLNGSHVGTLYLLGAAQRLNTGANALKVITDEISVIPDPAFVDTSHVYLSIHTGSNVFTADNGTTMFNNSDSCSVFFDYAV